MARAALAHRPGEAIFAAAVAATGAGMIAGASRIPEPVSAGSMGPRIFPYLVGTLLALSGCAILLAVLKGHRAAEESSEDMDESKRTDWRTLAIMSGVFIAHVTLIVPAGWPIAAWVLFAGVGLALGARPWWKPVAIGAGLAFILQLAFGGGLGLSLPPGPLLEWVSFFHG